MTLNYYSLESIRAQGVPVVIDDIPLSYLQAKILIDDVQKYMFEADHDKETAIRLAVGTFRSTHNNVEGEWRARKLIRLGHGHGRPIRNKHYNREERSRNMPRGKVLKEQKVSVVRALMEAGARNSKIDKELIKGIVHSALMQLTKGDRAEAVKATMKKLGIRLRENV